MAENQKLANQVKKNYKWIVKNTHLEELLDVMYQEYIFEETDCQLVRHEPVTDYKNRKFLDILFKKKQNAFSGFLDALYVTDMDYVIERIKETHIEDEKIEQGSGMANAQKLTKQVKKNYKWIVKDTNLEDLLDGMYTEDIFTINDKELVSAETTTENKNRKFLDILLTKNKQKAFNVFFEELNEVNRDDVVKRIKETPVPDEEIEQGASGNSWRVTSNGVPPTAKLDDKFMLKVANTFSPANLDAVATSLGLSKADVDQARMTNQFSPITQSHHILVKWRNKNSLHPNVLDMLLQGLEDAYSVGIEIEQDKLYKCIDDLKK